VSSNRSQSAIRIRLGIQARSGLYPAPGAAEEVLGLRLLRLLKDRIAGGLPRPSLFLFYDEVVQVVDLSPILRIQGDIHRAISSFSTLEGVEVMGLVGVLDKRLKGVVVQQVAAVFLEWPDGRWWFGCLPLPLEGAEPEIQAASQGAGKPSGLGGWFSRARFEKLQIRLEPTDSSLVH
jgi:hypothetical protein